MNTLIVGAGAMGGLFAFLLHRAGATVTLVDTNPAVVKAIGENGLRVEGISGNETVPVSIRPAPAGKGAPDLVLFFVRCHQAHEAAASVAEAIGPRTTLVSIQNGVGHEAAIAAALGEVRLVVGCSSMTAVSLAPGHVAHTSWGDTTVAALDPLARDRAATAAGFFSRHGIKTTVAEDARTLLWSKAIVQVGMGAVTALTRVRNGRLLEVEPARLMVRAAVAEAAKVLEAAQVSLPYLSPMTPVEQYLKGTADHLSVMLQDVYQGRRTEVEAINGAVVKLAESLDMDAPVNRTLTLLMQTLEQGS